MNFNNYIMHRSPMRYCMETTIAKDTEKFIDKIERDNDKMIREDETHW